MGAIGTSSAEVAAAASTPTSSRLVSHGGKRLLAVGLPLSDAPLPSGDVWFQGRSSSVCVYFVTATMRPEKTRPRLGARPRSSGNGVLRKHPEPARNGGLQQLEHGLLLLVGSAGQGRAGQDKDRTASPPPASALMVTVLPRAAA